jgi:predicted small metal-binding protein
MSQTFDDSIQLFCVRCKDVGLNCNCTIYGINEENVFSSTISHMLEYHAIKPEEMTACMKLKILEYIRTLHSPLPSSPSSYNSHF